MGNLYEIWPDGPVESRSCERPKKSGAARPPIETGFPSAGIFGEIQSEVCGKSVTGMKTFHESLAERTAIMIRSGSVA
jgi:hypothetical protein